MTDKEIIEDLKDHIKKMEDKEEVYLKTIEKLKNKIEDLEEDVEHWRGEVRNPSWY